jgi:ubiquinone/menaquinone biosynthesis C-methylase UbiE
MHRFAPQNADRLESPERYALLPPEDTLRRFGLAPGMTFVDVGAGTGFFTRAAAEIVGPEGTAVAVDSSAEMLAIMRARNGTQRIRTVQSSDYKIPLETGCADLVMVAFVLHETEDRARFLAELRRLLKPDGRILILEWKKQQDEYRPALAERIGPEDLEEDLRDFEILEQGDLNASHYALVVR